MVIGAFPMGGLGSLDTSMAHGKSSRAERKAGDAVARIRMLETNLAKSLMISEALWELPRDRTKLTEKHLYDKLYQIDMRDGVLDGKNQRSIAECPDYKRKVSPRHPACIYCGHVIDDSIFGMEG